jgi:hypothetical protein
MRVKRVITPGLLTAMPSATLGLRNAPDGAIMASAGCAIISPA